MVVPIDHPNLWTHLIKTISDLALVALEPLHTCTQISICKNQRERCTMVKHTQRRTDKPRKCSALHLSKILAASSLPFSCFLRVQVLPKLCHVLLQLHSLPCSRALVFVFWVHLICQKLVRNRVELYLYSTLGSVQGSHRHQRKMPSTSVRSID